MEATLLNQSDNGQIKLREISLFNWGSFADLHTAHIDPNGTLITGTYSFARNHFLAVNNGSTNAT
ncbi:MAG: hypothetical protein GXP20_03805 [Gammaproteobacteria bacterium]|nr:hypothetical protein [Gammaproteobacteria bacterium]